MTDLAKRALEVEEIEDPWDGRLDAARAREVLSVMTGIFQPLPSIALLPMAILWFGVRGGAAISSGLPEIKVADAASLVAALPASAVDENDDRQGLVALAFLG